MEHAGQAHAERLQAARDGVEYALVLFTESYPGLLSDIAALIDAKVELALLERGL